MATGREKALFQICQVLSEGSPNAQPSKDAVLTIQVLLAAASTTCLMQVASEGAEDHSSRRRETAKSETSQIGKGRDLFRHPQQRHHRYVMEVDRIAGVLQEIQPSDEILQHGVRVLAGRRMDLVPRGATSLRGKPWNAHLQLQNSTTNGERTCDQIPQLSHLHQRQVLLARQRHQQPRQHLPPDPS